MDFEILKWILIAIIFIFAFTALTGAPYVPSRKKELRLAFRKLYKLSKDDLIVDLGSGDGVVLKVANEFSARGFGVEINPFLVFFTKLRFLKNKDITIKMGDLFKVDFPEDTSVVYLFGDDRDINKMLECIKKQSKKLDKSLYVISHGFEFPNLKPVKKYRAYFLYKVNA